MDKIDKVLYVFDPKERKSGMSNREISELLESKDIEVEGDLLNEILYKLINDRYLRIQIYEGLTKSDILISGVEYHILTFEGELFQQQGGYKQKYTNELISSELASSELKRQALTDERIVENTDRLNNLTRGLLIATTVAVLIALVSLLLPYFCEVKK